MSKNYLLIDGMNLGHISHAGHKLTLGSLEVQAIYGFIRSLRANIAIYNNYTPVVLWDGLNWRKQIHTDYKSTRKKMDTLAQMKRMDSVSAFETQIPYIKKALRFLGVAQVQASNMEADDLAAILGDRYADAGGKVVLLSGDQDWLQVIRENIIVRDPVKKLTINLANFEEITGVETTKQFVQMKGLYGDSGDDVPGVGGVGKKGAIEFLKTYGSFEEFLELVTLHMPKEEFKKLPKKYRDLVEDEQKAINFAYSMSLVDLRTKARPPMVGLSVDKGAASYDNMERFCETLLFKSILQNFDEWLRVFPAFHYLNEQMTA